MKVESTRLGEIVVNESDIVHFSDGILGFPQYKRYAWISSVNSESSIELLQSIDDPDLTFMVTDPFLFKPNYEFDLQEEWKNKLGINQLDDITVRTIITARANNQISVNLKAPIIVNNQNQVAAQTILDGSEYSLQYLIKGE